MGGVIESSLGSADTYYRNQATLATYKAPQQYGLITKPLHICKPPVTSSTWERFVNWFSGSRRTMIKLQEDCLWRCSECGVVLIYCAGGWVHYYKVLAPSRNKNCWRKVDIAKWIEAGGIE